LDNVGYLWDGKNDPGGEEDVTDKRGKKEVTLVWSEVSSTGVEG